MNVRKKILLVDDEELIVNSLAMELEGAGYDVATAANGRDGIDALRNGYFNLLVTDLMMEGMDGLAVLKAAKEIDPEIAVIILTGYGEVDSAVEALRLGASDYLLKPCSIDELQARIEKCLETQDLARKIRIYEKILPVCRECGKVSAGEKGKGANGEWISMDQFISKKTGLGISHGYCPDCFAEAMREIELVRKNKK
ncbi:MAG: sigma-54-dependent transcriptional regulator [Thermodesulfobacteriota bacterium]